MYALRRENGDVLFFDAVTDIQEQYTSSVTKHPIATGSYISDHTMRDNKKFSLSAVLSDADFNLERPNLSGGIMGTPDPRLANSPYDNTGATTYELNKETGYYEWRPNKQYQNNTPTKTTVKIEVSKTETWKKFLPETVSQFTKDSIPKVTVTQQTKVKTAIAVRDEMIYMWETSERFTLMEYRDNIVTRHWPDTVFTNLSFAQDADTGTGLFPIMELEQVTYKDIESVPITIRRVPNKGRQNGTVTKTEKKEGDDAQNEPTKASKKTALIRLQNNAATNSAGG